MTSEERFNKIRVIPWELAHTMPGTPVAVAEGLSCTDRSALYLLTCLLFWDDFAQLKNNQARADVLVDVCHMANEFELMDIEPKFDNPTIPEMIWIHMDEFLNRDGRCEHVKGQINYVSQKMLYWFMAMRNGEMFQALPVPGHTPLEDLVDSLIQSDLDFPEPEALPE